MTLVLTPCKCGHAVTVEELLNALAPDAGGSTGFFISICAGCKESTVLSIQQGRIETGYNYWAGSMHFEVMYSQPVPGLGVEPSDPDDLTVKYKVKTWRFQNRRIQKSRFVIPPGAPVIGARITDLNLGQWGISLSSCERAGSELPSGSDIILQEGDALNVEGVERMLARVWKRIADGL